MSRANEAWVFRRRVVRAATGKRRPDGVGMRRPEHRETPLSADEIFFGAARGLIALPPLPQPVETKA